jgi:aspartokinase
MITLTTDLSTRSNLANVALSKDTEIQKLIPEFFTIIQYDRGDVLRIIQADESIKVLINEKNLKKIIKVLPEEKILSIDENLAEINLHLTNKAKYTPGVLALITNELALNGVSIVEVLSCFPELLWFVYQKDLLKAYNILYQLCQSNKK